ncbi:TIGR03016 family PEP-CTERM system-associated outer membrane protein [Roseateles amylovorans]|uniref:TIGR03016 family PEP-CTERM system-associated outer membrane protein n=1 Tax=Roseateles amylovorans TaxID=2978473 RepID=A0ABY6AU20_9BURK|nr:TIGR03016 family PEP-CTERM system-associated outer membrane protein [Roseateles amylovorans]UXH76721.1 TIGR03016 family PEP-CTERM system-associated outer membrane protein [Roseateles amylovorans]
MPRFVALAHPYRGLAAACLLMVATLGVQAQSEEGDATRRLGTTVTPRIGLSETWTDNLTLAPDGQRDRALITTVSPGLTVTSQTGMVRGVLDYTLDGLIYLKSEQKNRLQNQLNLRGNAELVPRALFVDVQGNISQQSISAFGQQSVSNQLDSPNRTEVRTWSVTPYWRGALAGVATFELRANGQIRTSTESGGAGANAGDSKEGSVNFSLAGPQGRLLNWGLQANTRRIHYDQTGLDNRSSSAVASLTLVPDIDWAAGLNAGRERSDFLGKDTSTIYGASLKWTPSPRTTFNADWQHHSYGNSHNLLAEHRMTQFVLRVTSSESVSSGGSPTGQMNNYQLLDLQFTSIEPDPVRRDTIVRATLAALGLSADAITSNGFVANTAMLQRRTDVSLAWTGPRLTLTLSANDNTSRRLGVAPTGSGGDLALTDNVRQRGATLSVSYRFTPLATGTMSYTRQHSSGDGVTVGSGLRSLFATTTIRLGPRTDATVGLRQTRSEDQFLAYRENAVYAQLSQRF